MNPASLIISILLFVVFALPMPFFFFAFMASLMAVMPQILEEGVQSFLPTTIVYLVSLFFQFTYPLVYGIAVFITVKRKKIMVFTFLPLFSILLILFFYFVSMSI